MRKSNYPISAIYILSSLLIINLFIFSTLPKKPDKIYKEKFLSDYKIYAVPHPDELDFAGENVPFDDIDVKERFDRELLVNTYWQSQTMLFFKRANRWFPVIESILKEEGLPDDFKYLAIIESGLTNAVSPAGARGFWQFLSGTGKDMGLEIRNDVDERYHVEKSTRAASKYLKEAYEEFGSWTLAAAAYNMGKSALRRQMKNQYVDNYYDLNLNEETARFVFRILAIKHIFSNPIASGFHFREKDLYPPLEYDILKIDTSITDLPKFAIDIGINYKTLRQFNPWLRTYSLSNQNNKTYKIKIPEDI